MSKDYEIGRNAAQRGYVSPPKASNWQGQQQRDAGWNHAHNPPPVYKAPPPPQPVKDPNRR